MTRRTKAVSGAPTPNGAPNPIHYGQKRHLDVHRLRRTRVGAKVGGWLVDRGYTRRLGGGLARGGERGRTCVCASVECGEVARGSTGVERRRLDRRWEVHEEVLVARSVEVNAERGLLTPLWHGESRVLEQDA